MPQKVKPKKAQRPKQHQDRQPGLEYKMRPQPKADDPSQRGCDKLKGKFALITGGDNCFCQGRGPGSGCLSR